MEVTTPSEQLRAKVEQEVNAVAAGVDRSELPESLGILIPSLDLQKSIDRIMSLFTQELKEAERVARIDEVERIPTLESLVHYGVKKYTTERIKALTPTNKKEIEE